MSDLDIQKESFLFYFLVAMKSFELWNTCMIVNLKKDRYRKSNWVNLAKNLLGDIINLVFNFIK